MLLVAKVTEVASPWHFTWSKGWITCPDGLTVMVKLLGGPAQLVPPLVNVGVTVMVAITGQVVVLRAVNDAILPLPFDAKPMLVVVLSHV